MQIDGIYLYLNFETPDHAMVESTINLTKYGFRCQYTSPRCMSGCWSDLRELPLPSRWTRSIGFHFKMQIGNTTYITNGRSSRTNALTILWSYKTFAFTNIRSYKPMLLQTFAPTNLHSSKIFDLLCSYEPTLLQICTLTNLCSLQTCALEREPSRNKVIITEVRMLCMAPNVSS